jgi:hypothetical protein
VLQDFLAGLDATNISQVHPSLANKDRLATWIERERLMDHPLGRSYDGIYQFNYILLKYTNILSIAVLYEYLAHHKGQPGASYIQHCQLYNDGTNILIICFNADQARQFSQARSFQVDMTFKRVFGDIKEVVFATMTEAFGSGKPW